MIKDISLVGYGRDVCRPEKARVYTIPDFYMIHFIESGSGYFDGFKLSAGDAFVCRRNEICHYFPDKKDPWTYTWINVKGLGADELINALPTKNNTFLWNVYEHKPILKRIWENKNSPIAEELSALSALYIILSSAFSVQKLARRDYVEEAKRLFESGLVHGITVEEVADKLNVSRAYLRNLFAEKTGISPKKYLMNLKMNRAQNLLHSRYSITEIAAAVGYGDALQFSKMFSKYFGMSPTEYRKNMSLKD